MAQCCKCKCTEHTHTHTRTHTHTHTHTHAHTGRGQYYLCKHALSAYIVQKIPCIHFSLCGQAAVFGHRKWGAQLFLFCSVCDRWSVCLLMCWWHVSGGVTRVASHRTCFWSSTRHEEQKPLFFWPDSWVCETPEEHQSEEQQLTSFHFWTFKGPILSKLKFPVFFHDNWGLGAM